MPAPDTKTRSNSPRDAYGLNHNYAVKREVDDSDLSLAGIYCRISRDTSDAHGSVDGCAELYFGNVLNGVSSLDLAY